MVLHWMFQTPVWRSKLPHRNFSLKVLTFMCRIHRHQEMDDLGFSGLRSQDSLGITRARLAKQRLNESTALLDDIKNMEVIPACGTLSQTWVTWALKAKQVDADTSEVRA